MMSQRRLFTTAIKLSFGIQILRLEVFNLSQINWRFERQRIFFNLVAI